MTPSITTITVTIIAVFEIPDLPPELERATVALVVLVEVMFVAVQLFIINELPLVEEFPPVAFKEELVELEPFVMLVLFEIFVEFLPVVVLAFLLLLLELYEITGFVLFLY